MNPFIALLLVYLTGALGYFVFKKCRLPLPALLGSITATAILAFGSGGLQGAPIGYLSGICKVVIGAVMGRRLNRNALGTLSRMLAPAALVSVWMVVLSLTSGILLAKVSGLPVSTALIGSSTGGVNEMAIFALSQNYDAATVTMISVFRLLAALTIIPWLVQKWSGILTAKRPSARTPRTLPEMEATPLPPMSRREVALLVPLATAGGLLFQYMGVPAGMMLGAMIATGAATLISGKTYPCPAWLQIAAQIGIGAAIAQHFGAEQLARLTDIRFLASLALVNTFSILATLLIAYILQRLTGWDPLTCLLSTSVGGMSQMILIAEEMNADALAIGILHLVRYLTIVSCMPFFITLLLS